MRYELGAFLETLGHEGLSPGCPARWEIALAGEGCACVLELTGDGRRLTAIVESWAHTDDAGPGGRGRAAERLFMEAEQQADGRFEVCRLRLNGLRRPKTAIQTDHAARFLRDCIATIRDEMDLPDIPLLLTRAGPPANDNQQSSNNSA